MIYLYLVSLIANWQHLSIYIYIYLSIYIYIYDDSNGSSVAVTPAVSSTKGSSMAWGMMEYSFNTHLIHCSCLLIEVNWLY
jgi:hypothetical protein